MSEKKDYIIILPNIVIYEPITIGSFKLEEYNPTIHTSEVIANIAKGLVNEGIATNIIKDDSPPRSQFVFCQFHSNEEFNKIVLDVRKCMALFRYAVFEDTKRLASAPSLDDMGYYILHIQNIQKFTDKIPEMLYSLNGLKNGNQGVYYYVPGVKRDSYSLKWPISINWAKGHYLVEKFNSGELEEKYIIAIERFNRTFKGDYDPVEDILNIITALENIIELKKFKGSTKAVKFAKSLLNELNIENSSIAQSFEAWAVKFYEVRGEIFHGNAFNRYSKLKDEYDYWEDCFLWKHPKGKNRFISHTSVAKNLFRLLLERLVVGPEVNDDEIDRRCMEEEVERLITLNEVYLKQLRGLVEQDIPYNNNDHRYFDIISKMTGFRDTTGEKEDIFYLLRFFLKELGEKAPEKKGVCEEVLELLWKEADTALIALKIFKISQSLRGNEGFEIFYLAQFFEKAWRCLDRIAWSEKAKK
jgi:hypothetical protein